MAYTNSSPNSPLMISLCTKCASRRMPIRSIRRTEGWLRASQLPMIRCHPRLSNPNASMASAASVARPRPWVVRVEHESRLTLPVLPAEPLQPDLADHLASLAPYHGERQPIAFRVQRGLTALAIQGLPDLRTVTGIPAQVPCHVWPRLVGVEVVEVAGGERAQGQPGRLNGVPGEQHQPMVAEGTDPGRAALTAGHVRLDGYCAARIGSRPQIRPRFDGEHVPAWHERTGNYLHPATGEALPSRDEAPDAIGDHNQPLNRRAAELRPR